MTLGEYLKFLRRTRGLKQKDLAGRIGIGAPYLSNLERGYRPYLGDQMLDRICQALNLSEEEIVRMRELREMASGHSSSPSDASEEAMALMGAAYRCAQRMPANQLRAVRLLLETYIQTTGADMSRLPEEERGIA